MPSLLFISTLITVAASLWLGAAVLFRKRRNTHRWFFVLMNFSIALWSVANYIALRAESSDALPWIRLVMLFAALQSLLLFLFIFTFPDKKPNLPKGWTGSIIVAGIVVMTLTLTPALFPDITVENGLISPTVSWGTAVFGLFALLTIGSATVRSISQLRQARGILRLQWRYISFGLLTWVLLLIFSFASTVIFSNTYFVQFSSLFTFIFLACTYYAILRHRFLDLQIILQKITARVIALAVLAFLYTAVGVIFLELTRREFGWNETPSVFAAVIVIILTFGALRDKLVALLESLVQAKTPRVKDFHHETTLSDEGRVGLERFVDVFTEELKKVVAVQELEILAINRRDQRYESIRGSRSLPAQTELISWLKAKPNIFVKEEVPYLLEELPGRERDRIEKAERLLDQSGYAAILPLATREEVWGVVFLSEKTSGEPLTVNDIRFLHELAREAAYALENVIMYKEAMERIGVK